MGRRDDHRGEGPWLMLFLVLLAVGAKPAAEAATPHHRRTPPPAPTPAAASSTGRADIPPAYLVLYQRGAHACPGLSWAVLAGIGKVETNHGRSRAPGVVSGVNRFGCCSGPMQFNIRNGPPSTWDAYGRGGNVYDPADAIPAAARLLCANGAPRNISQAIYAYNHAWWYVRQVLGFARSYQRRHP